LAVECRRAPHAIGVNNWTADVQLLFLLPGVPFLRLAQVLRRHFERAAETLVLVESRHFEDADVVVAGDGVILVAGAAEVAGEMLLAGGQPLRHQAAGVFLHAPGPSAVAQVAEDRAGEQTVLRPDVPRPAVAVQDDNLA